ncbi:hypothetical protein CYLTODRAFT_426681 [Cylindrobasidium torrendii FP15055 ss-10]|uniref:Uncharacterized protein n=1 Tax=Cylindrobasidium torrendii FP15055 ss-10 TaxID=1314674 RepID=A0A0D7AX04_9AGAR|nr:hypothetical protein CYLTODRAFT_426681 [Cylindrobasidium torrendii FP15055 ss-10]
MPTRRSRRIASPPSESATPNAERSRSPTPAPPRKVPRGTQDSDVRKARGRQKVAQQTLEAERKRQAHRAQNDSDASRIPHAGDSDETRLLKDKLDELSGQLHAANRHIHQLQEPSSQPPEDSPTRDVLRPSNLDKVKIKDLRLCLGLNGNEHNAQWNLIRTKVRMAMFGAHLDWQLDFKLQSKKKLGKLTEAV